MSFVYAGPKLAEMVTHPHFFSGQRYEAVGLDRTIRYLALWVVASPEAFATLTDRRRAKPRR